VDIHDASRSNELESQDASLKKKPSENQPPFKMDELIRTGFQSVVSIQRKILAGLLASPKKRDLRDCVIQGSSTVLIYCFDPKRSILHCGNIGDCELLVLRQIQPVNPSANDATENSQNPPTSQNSTNDNNKAKKASTTAYGIIDRVAPGCFSFNMPHQIGMQLIGSSLDIIDCPNITVQKIRVQSGDIVIAGSDGLFDNIFEDEILEMTGQFVHNTKQEVDSLDKANWEKLAKNLAKLAIRYGKDRKYVSPFAVKASEVSGTKMRGGKLDDTTVLVSYIA
jgi:serine/threonine protein phosphatase PrpC